jgi:restriction system protein
VLITTSQVTDEARDYVGRIEKRIVLVDGVQLAEFMMDHGVGVTEVASYRVQRVDEDYFASD